MSTIVTRYGKGSPLTWLEVDNNFTNLNTDKIQSGNTVAALTITSATINGGTITGITDLAVADGGTGLSSLTAGYIPFGAGTSAFGSSANLFWDSANNRLGIGTSSPSVKLDVSGSGGQAVRVITTDTSGTNVSRFIATYTGGGGGTLSTVDLRAGDGYSNLTSTTNTPLLFGTNTTERMRIDTSGNVGIGTSSPSNTLSVYNASNSSVYVAGDATTAMYTIRSSDDASASFISIRKARGTTASPTAVASADNAGELGFAAYGGVNYRNVGRIRAFVDTYTSNTNISGYLTFETNGGSTATTERMRIDSSGNVGIGVTNTFGYKTFILGGVNTGLAVGDGTSTIYLMGDGVGVKVGTPNAVPLTFNTSATERMRIDSSGNVGIGTSSPSSKLVVSGTLAAQTGALGIMFGYASSAVGTSDMGFIAMDNGGYGTAADMIISPRNNTGQLGNTRFYTAGSERMRIDSSGNVGIGVTPSAWSLFKAIQVNTGSLATYQVNNTILGSNAFYGSGGNTYISTGTATQYQQDSGAHKWYTAPSGTAGNPITFTEAMRIDSSGKVGIGTSSLSETLSLMTASGSTSIRLSTNNNQNNNLSLVNDATNFIISTNYGTTGNKIKMNLTCPDNSLIITSGGEVYIAGTTDQGAYNLQCNGTGVWGAGAYVNGSDERIKQDITPIDTGLDVVNKLNPVTYKYKEDWSKDQSIQTGFIAQDLLVALEGKNYVDGIVQQGGEYMSVAYQNIIPLLTKAIQELSAKVTSLEAQLQGK